MLCIIGHNFSLFCIDQAYDTVYALLESHIYIQKPIHKLWFIWKRLTENTKFLLTLIV